MYVKPQRPAAKPAKPVLKPDVIQSAMDKRPRLNANMRRAPAKPSGMNETPGINPAAGMPNGLPPRLRALAAKDPAAAQGRYQNFLAGKLPGQQPQMQTDILTAMPPGNPGGPMAAGPKGPFAGGPPPMAGGFSELPMEGGGIDPNGGVGSAVQSDPGFWTPERIAQAQPMDPSMFSTPSGPPSGSQNPLFSANLPPQIMQRLQALQAGRGGAGAAGGRGVPGAHPPGTPAAGVSGQMRAMGYNGNVPSATPTLPDFYQNPVLPRGQRPVSTFDRRIAA